MLFIENGNVYEKTIITTETQIAEVITYKCPEFKILAIFENNLIKIEYLDWQDNHINTNKEFIFRLSNHTSQTFTKSKQNFIDGFFNYEIVESGEYGVGITLEGTDGASLFFEKL